MSEEQHIEQWRNFVNITSFADKEMNVVLNELINHFIDGTGTPYSSEYLTKAVSEHDETKRYMEDFSKVFEKFLQIYKGDYTAFADLGDFHDALKLADVTLSKYDYSWGKILFNGLMMSIHGWTDSYVDVTSFSIEPDGSYKGVLRFTFKDNFGLDKEDLPPKYAMMGGFRSWYILQHYDGYSGKYKPFKTVVEIGYPISGKI